MRVALACSGLGRVERGYETWAGDVARTIGAPTIAKIYKGGEKGPVGTVLPNLPRDISLRAKLTDNWERAYRWEQLSFGIGLSVACLGGGFDIVHFPDLLLASVLKRAKRLLGLDAKLLFTNCAPHSPDVCGHVDYMHVATPAQYNEALEFGFSPERLFSIPLGTETAAYLPDTGLGEKWRQRLQIEANDRVILTLASLTRRGKRIDWLIDEIGVALDRNADAIWIAAGARADDSEDLERKAYDRLGGRFRFVTVEARDVVGLISCADLAILGSLHEGFGLSVVETCAAGVATLVNDHSHFRWLLSSAGSHVDMTLHGPLAARIEALLANADDRRQLGIAQQHEVRRRFDWNVLKPHYHDMYAAVHGQAPHR